MTQLAFDATIFREQFPAFINPITYPTSVLEMYWGMAGCYVDNNIEAQTLLSDCLRLALNYVVAHMAYLNGLILAGQTPQIISSSTIDKVSVTLEPPPAKDNWNWWLNTTPYGQALLALLQVKAVGGLYVGGLPEGLAFRKYAGIF